MDRDNQVDTFFDHLDDADHLELSTDELGSRTVEVQTASRRRSSVLVKITEENRDLVTDDVNLRARVEGDEDTPPVCATFDRADRNLARLQIRPPEALGRRESARVDSPSNADATLVDDEVQYDVEVLDIGLGGLGVALPLDCGIESGRDLEVRLSIGADWSLTCTGTVVYVEPRDDFPRDRAGIEFHQLSEEWRQSMFRILESEDEE